MARRFTKPHTHTLRTMNMTTDCTLRHGRCILFLLAVAVLLLARSADAYAQAPSQPIYLDVNLGIGINAQSITPTPVSTEGFVQLRNYTTANVGIGARIPVVSSLPNLRVRPEVWMMNRGGQQALTQSFVDRTTYRKLTYITFLLSGEYRILNFRTLQMSVFAGGGYGLFSSGVDNVELVKDGNTTTTPVDIQKSTMKGGELLLTAGFVFDYVITPTVATSLSLRYLPGISNVVVYPAGTQSDASTTNRTLLFAIGGRITL
ncbi:MAG: hypothetical protein JNL32_14960 [Candidatus Kapabacteria bacterium]|nr:hypothetical protein [Candidatus Kapabacteria bacterium]